LAFGHEAAAFIKRHTNQPWFLYLAFNAPHTPLQPTAERLAKFAHIKDMNRRKYVAQVSLMDDAIGETLAALRQTKQDRRTLVFFFSDNGAPPENGGQNTPLRGWKGECYEGGMHVPFLVSWPGTMPAGKEYKFPVISLDVFPTALVLAGVPLPTDKPSDGVNLIPYLTGKQPGPPHERLFWRTDFFLQAGMRDGNMKFFRDKMEFGPHHDVWHYKVVDKPDQLFDLATDLGEQHNLGGHDPATLKKLQVEWEEWNKQMAKQLAFPGDHGPEREWPKQ